MTTNSISTAYINALLADATYVDGLAPDGAPLSGSALVGKLQDRLTPSLAQYLADNFEVVTQKLTSDNTESGFDATVWREKSTGKIYVSMRGTEFSGYADAAADADLTFSGLARDQAVSMVNWWLKSTTPTTGLAAQLKIVTPLDVALIASGYSVGAIVAAPPVQGDNAIPNPGSVIVNGHRLGGHLATAFARIFGNTGVVAHTYTYNSATFNPLSPDKFDQIAAALGTGPTTYPSPARDTNFYAVNGPDLTTQNLTAGQIGLRVQLFNEQSSAANLLTLPNHYMYKLTDALALGNALEQLDPTLTISKFNALLEAGSNQTANSIEGVLDALRKALAGPHEIRGQASILFA